MLSRAAEGCCGASKTLKSTSFSFKPLPNIAGGRRRPLPSFEAAARRVRRSAHASSVRGNARHATASGCGACAAEAGMLTRQRSITAAQWPPAPHRASSRLPRQAAHADRGPDEEQSQPTAAAAAAAQADSLPGPSKQQQQQRPKLLQQRQGQEDSALQQASAAQRLQRQPYRQQLAQGRASAAPLRQQLKQLQQQQVQQQQAHDRKAFRAAAAGSTALLVSLLQSELPQLLAPPAAAGVGNAVAAGAETPAAAAAGDAERRAWQRWLAVLSNALVTISWHCKTHELLPTEAAWLRELLLLQLLPALGPHLKQAQRSALARVVFSLGSCHACAWPQPGSSPLDDGDDDSSKPADAGSHGPAAPEDNSSTGSPAAGADAADGQLPEQSPSGSPSLGEAGSSQQAASDRQQQQQQQQQQHSWAGLSSEQWVRALLPLLPPERLSPGALLAAWQGCALHGLLPPQAWLDSACLAAFGALQQRRLDHTDTATLLQSCAQLQLRPPAWLMHELVAAVQQQLPFYTPADLAGGLAALQALSFRPSNTFLRVWCEASSRLLRGMTASQLAAAAGGLSWAGHSPPGWWVRRLVAASQPLLPVADEDDLLLLLHALMGMRPQPPTGWLHEAFCHLRASSAQLSLRQVADAAHVLAGLQLPSSFRARHRRWLAACLRRLGWQQLAVADGSSSGGLSRSELLFTLYAAGKLQVAPGGAWLAVALRRLHQSLPGASPAELAASFVVFCHFWRSQQQQQQQQQQQGATRASSAAVAGGSGSSWLQLQECLAAAAACVDEFSDEGLLQLLLACADVGLTASPAACPSSSARGAPAQVAQPSRANDAATDDEAPQQRQRLQAHEGGGEEPGEATSCHVRLLADTLAARMERVPLVQLSRLVKALEGRAIRKAAAAGDDDGGGGGRQGVRLDLLRQLLQRGKAIMAGMA